MPPPLLDKGCGTFVVGNMATPWNKLYQILLSRNYVYMFVDLERNQEHNNKY